MRNTFYIAAIRYGMVFKGGGMVDKIVIVVENGMVQSVYGTHLYQTDIEVLDLDCTDPEADQYARERKQTVEQNLCKIY